MLERPPFPRLANAMRRQILLVLGRQGQSLFLNLARLLQVKDHRKVNFLPKVLRKPDLARSAGREAAPSPQPAAGPPAAFPSSAKS